MDEVYAPVRERMRQRRGMVTAQDALQEITWEDAENVSQALEEMIATEEDPHNKTVLEEWRNLPPDQLQHQIDISFANCLKNTVEPTDPRFYWHKLAYHPDNPKQFDLLLQDLKRKGLM